MIKSYKNYDYQNGRSGVLMEVDGGFHVAVMERHPSVSSAPVDWATSLDEAIEKADAMAGEVSRRDGWV